MLSENFRSFRSQDVVLRIIKTLHFRVLNTDSGVVRSREELFLSHLFEIPPEVNFQQPALDHEMDHKEVGVGQFVPVCWISTANYRRD